jgi:hypothetical protein
MPEHRMKTHTKIILATLGVAVLVGGAALLPAFAHDRDGDREYGWRGGKHGGMAMMGAHGGMGGFGPQMMVRFDTDGDGKLTLAEITARREASFRQFDADGNGTLALAEYEALWADAMKERMVDRFQHHDDDGDGQVSLAEFNDRFVAMVRFMDRDGDGDIDADDRPRRKHRD